jgi:hypothetical protein
MREMSERLTAAWAQYDRARNDDELTIAEELIEDCQNADEEDAANEQDLRD